MTQIEIDPQDGRWYRDDNYSMEQWGWEAQNGDDPPDYLVWVQQKYEDDDVAPPQSLIDEIERIGTPENDEPRVDIPDEFRALYPVEDWQYEAENNDTRLGYRNWLEHQLEDDEEWVAFVAKQTPAASPAGPKGP